MAAESLQKRWEGKSTAKLKGVKADQVWPLFLHDFCSVHKWLPTIDTCRRVHGVDGEPGLVRYCASTPTPSPPPGNDDFVLWCHEKLVAVDPAARSLRYEVMENNLGMKWCESTIKVVDEDELGCEIEWSFMADPFEGLMNYEAFSSYVNFALQGMAENMQKSLINC